MIHAVLDTNVLASGAVATKGPIATIIEALAARQFSLTTSISILVELKRTLEKPYFATKLTAQDRLAYQRLIAHLAAAVVPTNLDFPRIASHPEDDPILETTEGKTNYLVTGDRQLLKLGTFKDTKIISPAEFAAILEELGGGSG